MAPAIRDGLVRVSAIDPKGMELAYGRRIFGRYAVTSADALALLDDLVDGMEQRKAEFAGRLRTVPITREHPMGLLEFDEIGALIRYVGDRKTREAIIDRVALLATQGRALGYTVRGYVQEPTKTRCRCGSCSPAASACASRPRPTSGWCSGTSLRPGSVGQPHPRVHARCRLHLRGSIREPLRIRAGWVPDLAIKMLEEFVAGPAPLVDGGKVLALPAAPAPATPETSGSAA